MFEQHVDTKLVNAMSQGLPVITTQEGVQRAHAELGEGVLVAAGAEQMFMTVHQLMTDESLWQLHASAATRTAAVQLADRGGARPAPRFVTRIRGGVSG